MFVVRLAMLVQCAGFDEHPPTSNHNRNLSRVSIADEQIIVQATADTREPSAAAVVGVDILGGHLFQSRSIRMGEMKCRIKKGLPLVRDKDMIRSLASEKVSPLARTVDK